VNNRSPLIMRLPPISRTREYPPIRIRSQASSFFLYDRGGAAGPGQRPPTLCRDPQIVMKHGLRFLNRIADCCAPDNLKRLRTDVFTFACSQDRMPAQTGPSLQCIQRGSVGDLAQVFLDLATAVFVVDKGREQRTDVFSLLPAVSFPIK
jgi:hypothetical protein